MDRRELFKILGAGLAAGGELFAQHPDTAGYQPRFFSSDEYRLIGLLCDILIPADALSPGAREAGVPYYVDSVLFHAEGDRKRLWRTGLQIVDDTAKARFHRAFVECSPPDQNQIVALMAENEEHPQTGLQKFFQPLKQMVLTAYVFSDIGMHQYLGYDGDAVLAQFRGCDHPEHQPALQS